MTLQRLADSVAIAMLVDYEEFQELMHKQGNDLYSPLFLIFVPNPIRPSHLTAAETTQTHAA